MANLVIVSKKFHSHDCNSCRYCGSFLDKETADGVDVYYCPSEGSLVLRDGTFGSDYSSFPLEIAELIAVQSPTWAMAYDLYDKAQI